jgi:hypothetical protein
MKLACPRCGLILEHLVAAGQKKTATLAFIGQVKSIEALLYLRAGL